MGLTVVELKTIKITLDCKVTTSDITKQSTIPLLLPLQFLVSSQFMPSCLGTMSRFCSFEKHIAICIFFLPIIFPLNFVWGTSKNELWMVDLGFLLSILFSSPFPFTAFYSKTCKTELWMVRSWIPSFLIPFSFCCFFSKTCNFNFGW